jgi:hypothetical protein
MRTSASYVFLSLLLGQVDLAGAFGSYLTYRKPFLQ